jgi:hypothetical protein
MADYRIEFPDFDPATLPAIPAGFKDVSWHNDVCPAFFNSALLLSIFIDYADMEQREWPDTPRFYIFKCNEDGSRLDEDSGDFVSDDWDAIIAYISANKRA